MLYTRLAFPFLAAAAMVDAHRGVPSSSTTTTTTSTRTRGGGSSSRTLAFFGNWGKPAAPKVPTAAPAPAAAAAPPRKLVDDRAPSMPKLYGGWFDNTLIDQASAAINAALKDGS